MPLAHAILGFLEDQPRSGYDLKKLFDQSVAHFWSATQSHIYKALAQLEADGRVQAKLIVQAGKPNRKEYHLTPAGRAELRRWVTTPLPPAATREAWLVQIFFSQGSSNEAIAQLLRAREKAIRAGRDALPHAAPPTQAAAAPSRQRLLRELTADYGLAYYQAELDWLEHALQLLQTLPPPAPAGRPTKRQRKKP